MLQNLHCCLTLKINKYLKKSNKLGKYELWSKIFTESILGPVETPFSRDLL